MAAPPQLPANFFDKLDKSGKPGKPPNELPPDFFGPGFPKGSGTGDLPVDLPQRVGKAALSALPMIGGAVGAALAPEAMIPAIAYSAAGGGLGSLLEEGARKLTGANPAKTFGEAAKRVGTNVVEQGATELGGQIVSKTLGRVLSTYFNPKRLYGSALKPAGKESVAGKSVITGIREGIVPGEGAKDIVRGRVTQLNSSIDRMIQNAPADIPPNQYVRRVQSGLNTLRARWGKDAVNGTGFVEQIDGLERAFLLEHGNAQPIVKTVMVPNKSGLVGPGGTPFLVPEKVTIEPKDMSLGELRRQAQPMATGDAQKIKKATYETIRTAKSTAWDPGVHSGPALQARQEIAHSLMKELEGVYPAIKKLNRREGALIDLEGQLDRFAGRELRKQVTPYFVFPIAGALFGGATHGAEGAGAGAGVGAVGAHLFRSMLEDPGVKARVAIALANHPAAVKRAGQVAKQLPGSAARGVEAMATSR